MVFPTEDACTLTLMARVLDEFRSVTAFPKKVPFASNSNGEAVCAHVLLHNGYVGVSKGCCPSTHTFIFVCIHVSSCSAARILHHESTFSRSHLL